MPSGNNINVAPHTGRLHFQSSSKVTNKTIRRTVAMETGGKTKYPLESNSSRLETGDEKTSKEAVEKVLSKINEMSTSQKRRLNFSYDERIEKIVVKVMEGNTEKVIRQIPSEELIRQSLKMDEIIGLLLNQNA
jgi:flagellar protein FlaG